MIEELTKPVLNLIGTAVIGALSVILILVNRQISKWFLDNVWNKLVHTHSHSKLKKTEMDKNRKIREILIELRTIVRADRTCLFQFHNGSVFTSKEPIWKVSSTHESVAPGISSEIGELQDIKASSIIETLQSLWSNDNLSDGIEIISPEHCRECPTSSKCKRDGRKVIFIDVSKLEDSRSRSLLIEQGINYVINVPIYNEDSSCVGFVAVNYCTERDIEEIKDYADDICRNASQVQFLLLS